MTVKTLRSVIYEKLQRKPILIENLCKALDFAWIKYDITANGDVSVFAIEGEFLIKQSAKGYAYITGDLDAIKK